MAQNGFGIWKASKNLTEDPVSGQFSSGIQKPFKNCSFLATWCAHYLHIWLAWYSDPNWIGDITITWELAWQKLMQEPQCWWQSRRQRRRSENKEGLLCISTNFLVHAAPKSWWKYTAKASPDQFHGLQIVKFQWFIVRLR